MTHHTWLTMHTSKLGQVLNKLNSKTYIQNSARARAKFELLSYVFESSPTTPNSARLEYNSNHHTKTPCARLSIKPTGNNKSSMQIIHIYPNWRQEFNDLFISKYHQFLKSVTDLCGNIHKKKKHFLRVKQILRADKNLELAENTNQ